MQVFGTPQPSTGILGIGENISVVFNKPIVEGSIMSDYVQVNGVLNGSPIAHATSLNLDGASGYAKADGFSFAGSPFTVEFWMQRNDSIQSGVIFSKGVSGTEKIEITNIPNKKMQVTVGSNSFTVDPSIIFNTTTLATAWHHYALVYDTTEILTMYGDENEVPLLSKPGIKYSPLERGPVYIGRSASGGSFGKAKVDEVRIWNTARSLSDIVSNMSIMLSGSQQGLVAYWPCNEGTGTLATDRAGSHTLTINASWIIALQNEAVQFDATKKQTLLINSRQLTLSNQQNATIEFWFKAPVQTRRACLLYNGVIDSTAKGYNPDAFGLFLETSGKLTLTSGGTTVNATNGSVCDNAWHHFALVIDRLTNVRTYLDGNLQSQLSTSLFNNIVGLDMSLGAYHKQINSTTAATNLYYTGMIDEFRIWETARQAGLINKYMHTKLLGTEPGLLYYFPFEAYYTMSNVQVLGTTFKNNVNSATLVSEGVALTDTVVARKINGVNFTLQAPAVKDAQPSTNLAVTFEVNNDELLINLPTQYASLYENCVLDISVRNIFDKDGNMLQSPAQWTAYVNQNPVVWNESSDTLDILAGHGATFTASIVNKGGLAKDFTINGLPVWLTADPQSGTAQPNSSQAITFSVNNGLNIGSYSLPVNLTTDYGYDEKLQLSVTVNAQSPNWTVIPGSFQYSMSVFGKVQIAGVVATNTNDIVAAFVNGQCRGVATLKYLSNFDIDEAMLTVYSNKQSGETVQLLVWDANTGQTYSNVTPVYNFSSDAVYGTPKSPVLITCGTIIQNTYSLNAGWNWISINLKNPVSNSVENLLGSIGNAGDIIKGQKSVYDQFSIKAGWSGSLSASGGIHPESMYKISLSKVSVVSVNGTPVNPDSTKVSITAGWNWIGFVPQYNISVNEALASYGPVDGDIVKSQRAFSIFYTGIGWIGTLTTMTPGNGYMLQTASASTLIYPKKGSLKNFSVQNEPIAPKILGFTGGDAQSNVTILAQLADSSIDLKGKVLAAYNGKVCTGFATPASAPTGKEVFYLMSDVVNDTISLKFALVDTANGLKTLFANKLISASDNHIGQFGMPYLLYTNSSVPAPGDETTGIDVFPNPFVTSLNVHGYLDQDSRISISLINALGNELLKYNTNSTKGTFSIDLYNHCQSVLNNLTKGWYIVEVKTNSGSTHISVLKQ